MGCIYRIYCKSTGKPYIGQYKKNTPDGEWNRYINEAKRTENPTRYLIRAIKKHGPESFDISVICLCETQEELDKKEDEYITEYKSMVYENGYNMVRGGRGRAPDFHHQEEHKRKMSEFMKNRIVSDETKDKIRQARTGTTCPWSDETRAKVSESSRLKATGVVFTEARKKRIGEKSKGRVHTDEVKKKMSELRQGKPSAKRKFSDEQIRYIRSDPDRLGRTGLSEKMNVSPSMISNIRNRKCYIYVVDDNSISS